MTDRLITPFGFHTDADEIVEGIELPDARIIVTGGASGIGVETARALARTGAEVTLAVRRVEPALEVARDITASTGNHHVFVEELDLSDQDSVRDFTARWEGPLDVLVNNAGVMALPEKRTTSEGWELQFATNHLGHFHLAIGLIDALSEAPDGARIVSLSSRGHRRSPVVFDDINFERRDYEPWAAYGQAKTANVLFAVEADRRWSKLGIRANAVHPGGILTPLARHMTDEQLEGMKADPSLNLKTTQQGAATSVLLAVSPLLEATGGRYFEDCNEAVVHPSDTDASDGVRDYALDPDSAERLWDVSLALLGIEAHATH